jgi:hypothetical protein
MLTNLHLMLYTWWCWHICKREVVGVELDQLGEEKTVFWCTSNYMMAFGLEFCMDPLCFGSNMQVGCVALWVSFPKCPRSSKLEFGAKSYSRFSAKGMWSNASGQYLWVRSRVRSVFLTCPGATGRTKSLVSDDLMRSVIKRALWNPSGSDRTLGESSPVVGERWVRSVVQRCVGDRTRPRHVRSLD